MPPKTKIDFSTIMTRIERVRDMVLGREPTILTEMNHKLDLLLANDTKILSALNAGKAVSFDISSAPVPATEQPPADIPK